MLLRMQKLKNKQKNGIWAYFRTHHPKRKRPIMEAAPQPATVTFWGSDRGEGVHVRGLPALHDGLAHDLEVRVGLVVSGARVVPVGLTVLPLGEDGLGGGGHAERWVEELRVLETEEGETPQEEAAGYMRPKGADTARLHQSNIPRVSLCRQEASLCGIKAQAVKSYRVSSLRFPLHWIHPVNQVLQMFYRLWFCFEEYLETPLKG